jgi:osmotically-inducible protein OsmY
MGPRYREKNDFDERFPVEMDDQYYLEEEDDFSDEAPVGHIYSDHALEEVVRELLQNSKNVNPQNIDISCHQTDVTLSGSVQSESEKNAAGSLVQLIHGVGVIHNKLEVRAA